MPDIEYYRRSFSDPSENKIAVLNEMRAEHSRDTAANFLLPIALDEGESAQVRQTAAELLRFTFPQDPSVISNVTSSMLGVVLDRRADPDLRSASVQVLLYNPKEEGLALRLAEVVADDGDDGDVRSVALETLRRLPNYRVAFPILRTVGLTDWLYPQVAEVLQT
jgi:hypothetical protein